MIEPKAFVHAACQRGYRLWSGVPCSHLQSLIQCALASPEVRYVSATNEGDAVAIAAGAVQGGVRGVVLLQNSGLGNALSPLTSLTNVFELPVLLVLSLRGEPGAEPDEPQHAMMGGITTRLLETIGVAWEYFPTAADAVDEALDRAIDRADRDGSSYALVMRKATLGASPALVRPAATPAATGAIGPAPEAIHRRHEFLKALRNQIDDRDLIVATTGYTGRELYALGDRPNQFYMVGSMGCASSFGLGLALAQPGRRVIVLDGDGAALMRLGAMAAIGEQAPDNLVHVIFRNGIHESTGGQSIARANADFAAIALALGYPDALNASRPEELIAAIENRAGLRLIQVPVTPGTLADLPRPGAAPPAAVARRLRRLLAVAAPP